MPRTAAARAQPPKAPAQRTPAIIAIERLAKLSGQGVSAAKMVTALNDILAQWEAEGLDRSEMRERLEALQNDVDAGMDAAENYLGEAETDGARAAARKQIEGLRAVQDRLLAVIS